MKKNTYTLFIFLLSQFAFFNLAAQTTDTLWIEGVYQEQAMEEIFEDWEARYDLLVFVSPSVTSLPTVSGNFNRTPLDLALAQLLTNTGLGFIFYKNQAVVIGPKEITQTAYSASYYHALENALQNASTPNESALIIGKVEELSATGRTSLKGTIRDAITEETIVGASVVVGDLEAATTTDVQGNFHLNLPTGNHSLQIRYVGYDDKILSIRVFGDGNLDVELTKSAVDLEEVVISADAPDANVENIQTGITKLDLITVKKLPTVLGEADVVKNLLLQPGVSSIGEGASGFNVRGGDIDQNLILQDEGILFNSAHALGFYSTFNADLLQNVTLYKGAVPAQYGGRIASVLSVEMRDGDTQKFKTKGGLGLVASRLSFEGPIVQKKSSFLLGLRSTYSDWILKRINVPEVKRSSIFFYDANFRYTHRINPQNTLILTAYSTRDDFNYNQEFGFQYQTLLGQIIYKKIFNDHLYSRLSLSVSDFKNEQIDLAGNDASTLQNSIRYYKLKEQMTFQPSNELKLDGGLSGILYHLPGQNLIPQGNLSVLKAQQTEPEKGLEMAVFVNAEWEINPLWQVAGGLRFNNYWYLGEKTVYGYSRYPYQIEESTGASIIEGVIDHRLQLEPRFSLRYKLGGTTSLKLGYSRLTQYINQLTNTDTPTPGSHWQLTTPYIPPKQSHNVSIGFFKNFKDNLWETSLDVYGRYLDQIYDYRNFAELITNNHIETEIRTGIGRTYGTELSIKKKKGTLNGTLSYTLSKSELKVAEINQGSWYASNIDKLHDLSFVGNLSFNTRSTLTINFNYSTGRPTTPPVGNYVGENGIVIPVYTRRNHLRIPDYHRLDLAYTMGMGYNKTKKFKTSWTFSIYNVYGRRNAFSVFYTQEPFQAPKANRFAVLGSAFPSISFNFEYQ